MADYVPGDVVVKTFLVTDLNGDAVTGLVNGNFTKTLNRRLSSGTYASASETPSVAEGGSGYYDASWTLDSDSATYYYSLRVEYSSATVDFDQVFGVTVEASGDDTTSNDAFCSIANVEAVVQRGAYSASSFPTSSQVTDMMAWRAAQIEAALRPHTRVTVAAGTNTIDTSNDTGRVLEKLAREANAYLAAADAVLAADVRDRGTIPDQAAVWIAEGERALERAVMHARKNIQARYRIVASSDRETFADSELIEKDVSF